MSGCDTVHIVVWFNVRGQGLRDHLVGQIRRLEGRQWFALRA